MTQLMDPAGLKPINLCTAYQPQTSTLACRKIHYTIQPANNKGADQIDYIYVCYICYIFESNQLGKPSV